MALKTFIKQVFHYYLLPTFFVIILYSCKQENITLGNTVKLDCIQKIGDGNVPDELYQLGEITPIYSYSFFTKTINVCGITLIAGDDISNQFMENVAMMIKDMFVINENTDTLLQQILLTNLYKYKTFIPLFYGEKESLNRDNVMEELDNINSVCDIIMEDVPDQVMEVVEHVLHHLTDIGLHHTLQKKWGLSSSSTLFDVTQRAIFSGYYDISQYTDISDLGVRNRVILQEYAYWIIYTSWDLRHHYGPSHSEWSIFTANELHSKLPESYVLYQETIPSVLTCPSKETLGLFF